MDFGDYSFDIDAGGTGTYDPASFDNSFDIDAGGTGTYDPASFDNSFNIDAGGTGTYDPAAWTADQQAIDNMMGAGDPTATMGGGNALMDMLKRGMTLQNAMKLLGGGADTGGGSLAKMLGTLGGGALDAYGISQRNKDLKQIADRSWAAGAPSRGRYESSFQPGFTMANDPGFMDSMNFASKANAHSLSKNFGNPADSPTAQFQNMDDLFSKNAYPALQNFRNTNANSGALASLASGANAASTQSATGQADLYNTIGKTITGVTNPQSSWEEWMKRGQQAGIFNTLKNT